MATIFRGPAFSSRVLSLPVALAVSLGALWNPNLFGGAPAATPNVAQQAQGPIAATLVRGEVPVRNQALLAPGAPVQAPFFNPQARGQVSGSVQGWTPVRNIALLAPGPFPVATIGRPAGPASAIGFTPSRNLVLLSALPPGRAQQSRAPAPSAAKGFVPAWNFSLYASAPVRSPIFGPQPSTSWAQGEVSRNVALAIPSLGPFAGQAWGPPQAQTLAPPVVYVWNPNLYTAATGRPFAAPAWLSAVPLFRAAIHWVQAYNPNLYVPPECECIVAEPLGGATGTAEPLASHSVAATPLGQRTAIAGGLSGRSITAGPIGDATGTADPLGDGPECC